MLRKIQLPLSIVLLVAMIFVWKNVLEKYLPGFFVNANNVPEAITALKVKGEVSMETGDKTTMISQGQVFDKPSTITTSSNSVLIIGYGENYASKIKIGPRSKVEISKYKLAGFYSAPGLSLNLTTGRLLLNIFNPSKQKILRVKTPNFSMSMGTTFIVESFDNSSLLLVKDGTVELDSKNRKPALVKAGTGLLANGDDLKLVLLKDYNMDWNAESTTSSAPPPKQAPQPKKLPPLPVVDLANINVPLTIEAELKNQQNRFDDVQNSFPSKQQALKDEEKKFNGEFEKVVQDQSCLEKLLQGCEFISDSFKNDPANLKNSPTHFELTDKTKARLQKEMSKAKDVLQKKMADLKAQEDVLQNELQVENDKLKNAGAKFEQFKTADQATQKLLLKDISEILDSNLLRAISNK